MIKKSQSAEYLLTTPFNYNCANLSKHFKLVSHDASVSFCEILALCQDNL